MPEYLVVDSPFNRQWHRPLIGRRYTKPPNSAEVRTVDTTTERAGNVAGLLALIGLPALIAFSIYQSMKSR